MPASLVVLVLLAGCASGGSATSAATGTGEMIVGTVVRTDSAERVLALGSDTQTGDSLGQGSSTNVRYGDATGVFANGQSSMASAIKPGNRVMIQTSGTGEGMRQASRVDVLYAPDPPLEWGHYVHGKIGAINVASKSFTVVQAGTNDSVRINYGDDLQVVTVAGGSIPATDLKSGDEVDVVLRLLHPDPVASRITRLH